MSTSEALGVGRWTARFPDPALPVVTTGFDIDEAGRRLLVASLPAWSGPLTDGPVPAEAARVRGLVSIGGTVLAVTEDRHAVDGYDCTGARTSSPLTGFGAAAGLALDRDGMLLVADTPRGTVDGRDVTTGRLLVRWAGLDGPEDVITRGDTVLAVDADGLKRLTRDGAAVLVHRIDGARSVTVDAAGHVVVGTDTALVTVVGLDPADTRTDRVPGLSGPFLVRAVGDRLHVSAPALGRVRVVSTAGGAALGESAGTVLGVTTDHAQVLWASDPAVTRHIVGTVLAERATAVVGPFPLTVDPGARNLARIRARGSFGAGHATLTARFLAADGDVLHGSPSGTASPDRVVRVPSESSWAQLELTVVPEAGPAPWIDLVELHLNGPALIDELPQVYRARGRPEEFLDPFLRLLATGLDEITDALVELPIQLDPATATDDLDGDRWLDWLSTWVDAPLDEGWDPALRRRVVAEAFRWHARRGTPAALRRQIVIEHGVDVTIDEPAGHAHVWVLGDRASELGRTTMTTAAPAEGAVLDRTAVLDRAHLIGPNDRGAPLFGDLAHRFTVLLPPGMDSPARRAGIAATVEREKPAHTHAHVCVRPGTVVGVRAVVGMTTVVGPSPPPAAPGGTAPPATPTHSTSNRARAGNPT
ncbi:phage tail protein [Georgenia wutianyii]|nr:phage tail protein [Georgenia wutianyii]